MRVLLVQAPSVEGPHAEIVAPLGLAAVAAAAVRRVDPEVVGVGLRNIDPLANRRHSYLPAFGALLHVVRRELPTVPLVVGGAGFSMFPRALMERYPAVDVGVFLEGEETFPAVLDGLNRAPVPSRAAGAPGMDVADLAGTPGTIVRVSGRLVEGPPRPWLAETSLDAERTWLPELARSYEGRTSYAPAAGVETKRGCPLGCSYCVYPALQGRRLRFRSPATIVAEVEALHREAGAEWVHFTDPVLNYPAAHFREVCRSLIERSLPVRWTGFFREDVLTRADAELAVRAGCAAFQFSGDGTCDRSLARLRKGLTLTDVLAAARAAAGTEALSVYHFMANIPGTDAQIAAGAHRLVELLHEIHGPRENLGAMVFNNLRVYPGTPLAAELVAAGRLDPHDHLLFPTYHDPAPYRHLRYELEERHHLRAGRRTGVRDLVEEAAR